MQQQTTTCKIALISSDPSRVPQRVFDDLKKHGALLVARQCESLQEVKKLAGDADFIWLAGANRFLKAEVLPDFPQCAAILRTGSGTDDIPVKTATERGIIVANTPEALAEIVAEHTMALLFAVIRNIAVQDRAVRAGTWDVNRHYPAHHFRGSSLGLISFGRIAQHVARMLSGFGMQIRAFDPVVSPQTMAESGVEAASFEEILRESDFISVHCPLNDKTQNLFSDAQFEQMKSTAILINTSRGGVIDQLALTRALTSGAIAAAGLDVLQDEPPQSDCALLHMDNVIITPHMAAFSDQFEGNFWQCSVNALSALANHRRPLSIVNPSVSPKWAIMQD